MTRRGVKQRLSRAGAIVFRRDIKAEQLVVPRGLLAFRSEAGPEEREADDLPAALRNSDAPALAWIPEDEVPHLVAAPDVLFAEEVLSEQVRIGFPPDGHVQFGNLRWVGERWLAERERHHHILADSLPRRGRHVGRGAKANLIFQHDALGNDGLPSIDMAPGRLPAEIAIAGYCGTVSMLINSLVRTDLVRTITSTIDRRK